MTTTGSANVSNVLDASSRGDRFLTRWIGATFGGWTVGFLLVLVLIALTSMVGLGNTQFPIGLGMGLGTGFLQARVLRGSVGDARRWWIASAAGLTAPFMVSDILKALMTQRPYSLALLVVAGGVVVSVLQWRVLRRRSRAALWWVPTATIGWCLGSGMIIVSDRYLPKIPGIVGALLYVGVLLVGGLILGIITAPVILRIVKGAGSMSELAPAHSV